MRAALAILAILALVPTAAAAGFNTGPAVQAEVSDLQAYQVFGVHPYDDLLAATQTQVTGQYPGYTYAGEVRLFCNAQEGTPFAGLAIASGDCIAYDNAGTPATATISFPASFAVDKFDAEFVSVGGALPVTLNAYDAGMNLIGTTTCMTPASWTASVNCAVSRTVGSNPITQIEIGTNQDYVGWDDSTFHINSTPVPELSSLLLVVGGVMVVGLVVVRRNRN